MSHKNRHNNYNNNNQNRPIPSDFKPATDNNPTVDNSYNTNVEQTPVNSDTVKASVAAINQALSQTNQQNTDTQPHQPPSSKQTEVVVAEDINIIVDDDISVTPLEDEEPEALDVDEIPEDADVVMDSEETKEQEKPERIFTPIRIGRYAGSKKIKNLQKISYDESVKVETSPDYQNLVLQQFVAGKSSGVNGNRGLTRVILPYSGFYTELISMSNGDQQSIYRATAEQPLIDKMLYELGMFYRHIKTNSLKPDCTFDEWLSYIKLPDLKAIYWGAYNNFAPGMNTYKSPCDKCGAILNDERNNYEGITFLSDDAKEDITEKDLAMIDNGSKRDDIGSYKKGCTIIEKKDVLPDSRIKVFYGMPTVLETFEFLRLVAMKEDKDFDELAQRLIEPLSNLRQWVTKISHADYVYTQVLKVMLYTRKVLAPVTEKIKPGPGEDPNKVKLKVTYVDTEPQYIFAVLDNLSKKDTIELCRGKELWNLISKNGYRFTVRDSICPSCGAKQRPLELDPRKLVFTQAAQELDFLTGL